MTNKEMSEIFSLFMMSYPRVEPFNGGEEKIIPVIKMWTMLFEDVPFGVMQKAASELVRTSPYPPSPADITKQIRSMSPPAPSKAELWDELMRTVDSMNEQIYYFPFTYREKEGEPTRGEKARAAAKLIYLNMRPEFRDYAGSYPSFIRLCRDCEVQNARSLKFEQKRFEEFLEDREARKPAISLPPAGEASVDASQ